MSAAVWPAVLLGQHAGLAAENKRSRKTSASGVADSVTQHVAALGSARGLKATSKRPRTTHSISASPKRRKASAISAAMAQDGSWARRCDCFAPGPGQGDLGPGAGNRSGRRAELAVGLETAPPLVAVASFAIGRNRRWRDQLLHLRVVRQPCCRTCWSNVCRSCRCLSSFATSCSPCLSQGCWVWRSHWSPARPWFGRCFVPWVRAFASDATRCWNGGAHVADPNPRPP